MSKKISSRLTAVAFAAALACAGTAQAGSFVGGTAGSEVPSWSMAWDWLTEAWGDLTGLRSDDSQTTVTTSSESLGGGDTTNAGCGIDPNGSPCGGA